MNGKRWNWVNDWSFFLALFWSYWPSRVALLWTATEYLRLDIHWQCIAVNRKSSIRRRQVTLPAFLSLRYIFSILFLIYPLCVLLLRPMPTNRAINVFNYYFICSPVLCRCFCSFFLFFFFYCLFCCRRTTTLTYFFWKRKISMRLSNLSVAFSINPPMALHSISIINYEPFCI